MFWAFSLSVLLLAWKNNAVGEKGKERDGIFSLEHAGGEFQGTFYSSSRSLFLYLVILIPSEILFLDLMVLILLQVEWSFV